MRCFHCMKNIPDSISFCPYCGNTTKNDNPPYCLRNGTVLKEKYIIGNEIDEGDFGITYIGTDLTLRKKVLIKEYLPPTRAKRNQAGDNTLIPDKGPDGQYFYTGKTRFMQEAKNIMQLSDTEGIVKVFDIFEENDTAYIVMDYVEGQKLSDIIFERGALQPKPFFEVLKYIGVDPKEIGFNQPKGMRYPTENPFA